jgi:hypothetical protein
MQESLTQHMDMGDSPELSPTLNPALLAQWTRVALSTNQADPFCCTPAWQLPFYQVFCAHRPALIKVSSGNVLAFAVKLFDPTKLFLIPIDSHWFFGCPVLGPGAVDLLHEVVGDIESLYGSFFSGMVISGIRPGGVLARRLRKVFSGKFRISPYLEQVQCAASLAGGMDGYLARRSGNHRRKIRRQMRRAIQKGVWFEGVSPSTVEDVDRIFARMLSVEKASWKGREQCGMDQEPAGSFYRAMLHRLCMTQSARIMFARHEDRDIGYIFGGMAQKIYRGQQFSYVQTWKDFSIGNLLQTEQIKWLCREKARRYDMGPLRGPKMEYKTHWTERQMHVQTWILVKK